MSAKSAKSEHTKKVARRPIHPDCVEKFRADVQPLSSPAGIEAQREGRSTPSSVSSATLPAVSQACVDEHGRSMPYACAVSFGSLVGCRRAVLERKTHAALMLRRMAMRQCSSPALSRAGSLCSSPARSIAATTMRAKEGTAARREAKLALTQKRVHEKACVFFPVLAWTHSKPFLPTATPYKHSRENIKNAL